MLGPRAPALEARVAHGALDLRPEQLGVVTEVALQRVLVDDDAVRVGIAGNGATDVVAVGMFLVTAAGDDYRRVLEVEARARAEGREPTFAELVGACSA